MEILAKRLRELRVGKKLSMDKLAKELKISSSSISRWENNQVEILAIQVAMLAKYFKVSADYLLGLSDYE